MNYLCKVDQLSLAKAVSKLQNLMIKKSTMQILSFYEIKVFDGYMTISGSDMECSIKIKVACESFFEGGLLVSGKIFSDIVRQLPEGTIDFSFDDSQRLQIKSGKTVFRLNYMSESEFPLLEELSYAANLYIDAKTLLDFINGTIYAVSSDDNRYEMSGVSFKFVTNQMLRAAATDGHRLATVSRTVDGSLNQNDFVLPKKPLGELRKILEEIQGQRIKYDLVNGYFIVETHDTKVSIGILDVKFPDIDAVIPKDSGFQTKISTKLFADALRRSAILLVSNDNLIRLDIQPGQIRLCGVSREHGEVEELVPVEECQESLTVGFNVRFLIDVVNCFSDSEFLCCEFLDQFRALRVYPWDDYSSRALVMPLRLPS